MDKLDEKVALAANIASIISFILGLTGSVWVAVSFNSILYFFVGIAVTLLVVSVIVLYKKRKRYTEIEGIRIEENDNIPLLVPRKNSINPIKVTHKCVIYETDAVLEYRYFGICCDKQGIEGFPCYYSASDVRDIENTNSFAYDLKNDPNKNHKILPSLASPKGLSKRVIYRFLKRVNFNTCFEICTYQECKNSVKEVGKDVYMSGVLYKNRPIDTYQVILEFHNKKPNTINVYEVKNKTGTFLYKLDDKIVDSPNDVYTYVDDVCDANAWSVRVYIFDR